MAFVNCYLAPLTKWKKILIITVAHQLAVPTWYLLNKSNISEIFGGSIIAGVSIEWFVAYRSQFLYPTEMENGCGKFLV